jgi:hypothetical protein
VATFTGPVITPAGLHLTVTGAATVVSPLLSGTTTAVNGAAPAWAPLSGVVRVYTPPGKGCYGWTSAAMIAAMKQHPSMIILSMKDTPTHALLDPVINNVPPGVTLVLIFHHEPDQGTASGDPSPAQYKADWTIGAGIVNALPAAKRRQVQMCEDFTEYAQTHGKEAWSDFWTGLADYCAVDIYTDALSTTTYPTAAATFALLLAVCASTGKPGLIPEYGAKRIGSDTTGTGCATMIGSHIAYLRTQPRIRAVIWWSSSPFTLDGRSPELAVWQFVVADH